MERTLELLLCDMQGQLFELSANKGYSSEKFVKVFMTSSFAESLDSDFDHLQWAGKEYILEIIEDELSDKLIIDGKTLDKEILFWTGYVYRYWHFYTGESSLKIYKQAPLSTMKAIYYAYHTLSVELAIDKLKETYIEKKNSKNK